MIRIRHAAIAVILAGALGSSLAFAQTSTPAAKATETTKTTAPAAAPAKGNSTAAKPDAAKTDAAKTDASKSASTSTTTSVGNWTRKQWNAMTKEWSKDKAKWSDCRKQSKDKKLSGRNSWSYLYDCMKKA